MAKDSRKKSHTCFISSLLVTLTMVAGIVYAADSQNFRIRKHQTIAQDFTAADVTQEIRFGQKVAARLLGLEKLYSDAELNRYVSLIGHSLILQAPRHELEYYFAVLDSNVVNAYSTPGGYVFITRGALAAAQDESEVAAVLAHEIAHITERHVVKELNISAGDQSSLSGIVRFLGSSGSTAQVAFQQAIDKAISIIHEQGYKLRDELEADRIATLLLAQSGYDPLALQRFLARVEHYNDRETSKTQTHSAPQERFSSLAELIENESLSQLNFPRAARRFNNNVKTRLDSQ